MLELSLLRHAKSSWNDPSLGDHERPLTKRGIEAAGLIGSVISQNGLLPDLILCSDAIRAQATLTLIRSNWPQPLPPTVVTHDLYLAQPDAILQVVKEHAEAAEPSAPHRIMVIGHNPGLHALALALSACGEDDNLARLALKYPTCAFANISFTVTAWHDIATATGNLTHYITPRELAR